MPVAKPDVAPVGPVAATGAEPPASDSLQAALAACAVCALGDDDIDPACGQATAWASARTAELGRAGGARRVAAVARLMLAYPATPVRLLAARAAALDLPSNATALVGQAAQESDPRVLAVLWSLLRGSPAEPAHADIRGQAAERLGNSASPAVQAAAVAVLDPQLDSPVLLAALATATDLARAAACEKIYASQPATIGGSAADPLPNSATAAPVRSACLVGAARAICSLDQGDARHATEVVRAALRAAPPWQLVTALACVKGMSDEARQSFARALRPVVDDEQAAPLARAEAVRTLAAMGAPAPWFGIWRQRYGGAKFGSEGLIGAALQAVVR